MWPQIVAAAGQLVVFLPARHGKDVYVPVHVPAAAALHLEDHVGGARTRRY